MMLTKGCSEKVNRFYGAKIDAQFGGTFIIKELFCEDLKEFI